MKKTSQVLFVVTLALAMVYGFNAEGRENFSVSTPEALILDPGMDSRCQNDFVVENPDKGDAEIKITLGNEEWIKDRIGSQGSKAYSLQGNQESEGRDVSRDEMATIFNVDPDSRIILHCKEKFTDELEPG